MSGGSYDYAYSRVREFVERAERRESKKETPDPLRLAFFQHLELVAVAMKNVEWVDSSDLSEGDEHEAIRKVFQHGYDESLEEFTRGK